MTRVSRVLLVAVAVIALLGVGLVDAQAQDDERQEAEPALTPVPGRVADADRPSTADTVIQTADEAMAEDIAIVAKEQGISQAEAAKAMSYQTRFSETVSKLLAGGTVAWSEVDPLARTGLVVFTGNAPEAARSALVELGGVEIQDGARFNVDEQAWRAYVVAQALRKLDVDFNVAPGPERIDITVPIGFGLSLANLGASAQAIAQETELPADGVGEVAPAFPGLSPGNVNEHVREFDVTDIHVTMVPAQDLVEIEENAHGGEEMTWWSGQSWLDCTSGFTVRNKSTFVRGISTAGHCPNVDYIRDNQAGLWHTTNNFLGHDGQWGDFGWYQTNGTVDALFRASGPANYRSQQATPVWYSVGSFICFFGHQSYVQGIDNRTCNHEVEAHVVSTNNNSNVSRVSNRRSTFGDSGGGYSWSLGAIGTHVSGAGTKQYYSPMGTVNWFYNLELAQ